MERAYVEIDGRRIDADLIVNTPPEVGERVWLDGKPATISSISRVVDEHVSLWSLVVGYELWSPAGWVVWLKPDDFRGLYCEARFTEDLRLRPELS